MPSLLWSCLAVALAVQEPVSVLQTRSAPHKAERKEVWVNIVRHCVRASRPLAGFLHGKDIDKEKLSSVKLPAWETVPQWDHSHLACTKRGLQIVEHTAKIMAAQIQLTNISLYGSAEDRITKSAEAMLRGLFSNHTLDLWSSPAGVHVKILPGIVSLKQEVPFSPVKTHSEKVVAMEKLALPMGVGTLAHVNLTRWKEVLHELESLIGVGPMGHLQDLLEAPSISWISDLHASPLGIIKRFATDLIYAFASGMNYSNATVEQRHAWIDWNHFARDAWNAIKPDRYVRKQACVVWKVLEDLQNAEGDSIWIGHDTTLDIFRILLQVSWEAPPYVSTSPTPAGGGVHIHRVGDFLEVSFSYAVFDGTATPDVRIVPTKPRRLRLVEFKERVQRMLHKWWPGRTPPAKKCRKILQNTISTPPPSSDGVD